MYSNEINLRVRYAETDQMGYVYYGNYAQYYEVGRVELLRSLGVSYKSLEKNGFELPMWEIGSPIGSYDDPTTWPKTCNLN